MITVSGKKSVVEDVSVEEIDVINQLFYNWLNKAIYSSYGGMYRQFAVVSNYWTAFDPNDKCVTLRQALPHEVDMWNAFKTLKVHYERE